MHKLSKPPVELSVFNGSITFKVRGRKIPGRTSQGAKEPVKFLAFVLILYNFIKV